MRGFVALWKEGGNDGPPRHRPRGHPDSYVSSSLVAPTGTAAPTGPGGAADKGTATTLDCHLFTRRGLQCTPECVRQNSGRLTCVTVAHAGSEYGDARGAARYM